MVPGGCGEFLLNNYVDKELQEVLRPIYIIEYLLVWAKYKLKDNFITSNSTAYKLLCCSIGLSNAALIWTLSFTGGIYKRGTEGYFYVLNVINTTCSAFEYIIALIGVFSSEKVVKLILDLQDVDKKLKYRDVKRFVNSKILVRYLLICIMLSQLLSSGLSIIYYNGGFFYFLAFVTFLYKISFDLSIVILIFIMEFLKSRIYVWIRKFKKINEYSSRHIEQLSCEECCKSFSDIMKLYKMVEQKFSGSVTLYISEIFFFSLCYVQADLIMSKQDNSLWMSIILVMNYAAWVSKILIICTVLCVKCERFYTSVDEAKRICVLVLEERSNSKELRHTSKNVLRICEGNFHKMKAFGIFTIDASLQLRVFTLTITYVVVLLQFALL